jgi:hypothetical protein
LHEFLLLSLSRGNNNGKLLTKEVLQIRKVFGPIIAQLTKLI